MFPQAIDCDCLKDFSKDKLLRPSQLSSPPFSHPFASQPLPRFIQLRRTKTDKSAKNFCPNTLLSGACRETCHPTLYCPSTRRSVGNPVLTLHCCCQVAYAAFQTLATLGLFRVMNTDYFEENWCNGCGRVLSRDASGPGPFYCKGPDCKNRGFPTFQKLHQHCVGTKCSSVDELFFVCCGCQRTMKRR